MENTIFICQDNQIAQEIIDKYFAVGKVTYVNRIDNVTYEDITQKLEELEN